MNMQKVARMILGLRADGWAEEKINNFMLFIETGEEQYKPHRDKEEDQNE
ncbi:MAG: hypothetical protein IKQ71_08630 [Lachnospiraceae bacterium]|nr:hypothetical protein [Lachnospiraceae bacterium]